MVFTGIVSSPRGSLSSQQTLELANIYLENAFTATDSDIALVLYHDTEVSLSQAKKSVKHDKHPTTTEGIAAAYIGLGKLLENRGHVSEAEASFKKAQKLGRNIRDLARPIDTYRPSNIMGTLQPAGGSQGRGSAKSSVLDQRQSSKVSIALTVPDHIFSVNIPPPTIEVKLPEPDERLINTPQLACCLGLLKVAHSPDTKLQSAALKWMKVIEKDTEEQERLRGIATDVIRAFKKEEIKDVKVVAEVVCLAPILDKEIFHDILREFYSGIMSSKLLDFHQLEGIAQLIQGADQGYLSADDLVKILGLLSTRLMDTHRQSSPHMHRLTMAVSRILDAMADTNVTDLDCEKLHEPLSSYLSGLKKSSDPFLVYQAAYAFSRLLSLFIPNSTPARIKRKIEKRYTAFKGTTQISKEPSVLTLTVQNRPPFPKTEDEMVFGNIVSSPRGSLSPQKSLELANIYLENAFNTNDSDIALALCHDTEVSLHQAKKHVKRDGNQTVAGRIATAYIGLGKLLESLHQVKGAQASFKEAEKLG
ncbi:hypothetical protein BGX34_004211, partial [Mortierella sp. NVP85]